MHPYHYGKENTVPYLIALSAFTFLALVFNTVIVLVAAPLLYVTATIWSVRWYERTFLRRWGMTSDQKLQQLRNARDTGHRKTDQR